MNDLIERLRLGDGTSADHELLLEAADALEALAQPEQEPVAVYRAGQAKGEVYHVQFLKEMDADEVLLYTTPPQRTWVDLSDEEILNIAHQIRLIDKQTADDGHLYFARAIMKRCGIS